MGTSTEFGPDSGGRIKVCKQKMIYNLKKKTTTRLKYIYYFN